MERESLSGNFQQDIRVLEDTLRVRQSFDVVLRRIEVGERQAAILFMVLPRTILWKRYWNIL